VFYGPSRWLLAGTQLWHGNRAMAQGRHGDALRVWLSAWAEFEALHALAGYSYENPAHPFPENRRRALPSKRASSAIPLLPQDFCVANDIELSTKRPFYIVSGSNMSGKSTLLRIYRTERSARLRRRSRARARSLKLSALFCLRVAIHPRFLAQRKVEIPSRGGPPAATPISSRDPVLFSDRRNLQRHQFA